jgi:predicted RNase H-like HicB family nuclease
MNTSYSVYVVPDETTDGEQCYLASHPELQGCMSHGRTIDEAVRNLDAARDLYVTTLQQLGQPIPPPPKTPTCVIWENVSATSESPDILPSNAGLPSQELREAHA